MTRPLPSAYVKGYDEARLVDRQTATNYVDHTVIGDPVMDAVIDELAAVPRDQVSRFIEAGMEQDKEAIRGAPQALRDFFVHSPPPDPPWLDYDAFAPGFRAFHANVGSIFAAFVTGTLIDGFCTLISSSFIRTGRVLDRGVRRLRQNNRHMVEIFFPGGLNRDGDGWKLSVRIRFIHAQVRRLLAESDDWDMDAWGVPVSAAHLGFAIACFSARTLRHSSSLGGKYTREQREGLCAVWRYAGHLMGIPDTILFRDEKEALRLYRIGSICEPPPSDDAVIMTNALINSAPAVAGIKDPKERRSLVYDRIYPISRALIGEETADHLNFPKSRQIRSKGILLQFRMDTIYKRFMRRMLRRGDDSMEAVFAASLYDSSGLTFKLPDHTHSEQSSNW